MTACRCRCCAAALKLPLQESFTPIQPVVLGDNAREAERYDMGARIREVEQGPDGAVWVLEDGKNGKLLKLTPKG